MELTITVSLPSGHSFTASGHAEMVLKLYAEWKIAVGPTALLSHQHNFNRYDISRDVMVCLCGEGESVPLWKTQAR